MKIDEAIKVLELHNEWRKGAEIVPDTPVRIGMAIDLVTCELKTLRQGAVSTRLLEQQTIPEWDGITDYRPPIFEKYEFILDGDPQEDRVIRWAALQYAGEIVGDPANSKWLERRKLTDAFQMGIEYAKRYLNGG